MGTTQDNNRLRQLNLDVSFTSLTTPEAAVRLSRILEQIQQAINLDRAIDALPAPTGFSATSKPASILLRWDDLPQAYKGSYDGAKVWRAPYALDNHLEFDLNTKKDVLVDVLKATSYSDPVGNNGTEYIYWVQWINLDGKASQPTGGYKCVALWDAAAPGIPQGFQVTGADGKFVAQWADPLTYVYTLDDFVIAYSEYTDFDPLAGYARLGKIYSKEGVDPNKTYYWKICAHNQSGDTTTNTDPILTAYLPDGWGPWSNFGAPDPVSSGSLPGVIQSNAANVLGANATLDLATNGARLLPRSAGSGSDPSTSDIPAGEFAIWEGVAGTGIWYNKGGSLKKVVLV